MLVTSFWNLSSLIIRGFVGFGFIPESFIGLIEDGFEGVSEFIVVNG